MLIAYYSTFDSSDNVALIVKTHLGNRDAGGTSKVFHEICEDIKRGLNRFKNPSRYPKVVLISQFLSDEQINSLHQTGDCFVTTSHGESFCLPLVESLGFSNYAIGPEFGSIGDLPYISHVEGNLSPCFGAVDAVEGLYSSDESWFNIDIRNLCEKMKYAFYEKLGVDPIDSSYPVKASNFVKDNYNYETIGKKMIEVICAE